MIELTKEQVQNLLKIQSKLGSWFGKFDLFIESFGRSVEISIALSSNSRTLNDRTIQTVNEVANLTRAHYEHILRLMFDDAMSWKAEAFSGPPPPPPQGGPLNWVRKILQGPRSIAVPFDEKHFLFGIETPAQIEAIIDWKYIFIDDCQETSKRVAFLSCYPPWETEHGREIAICDGVPTEIRPMELDPYNYVDEDYED